MCEFTIKNQNDKIYDYYLLYPNLIEEILKYFYLDSNIKQKNTALFCSHYQEITKVNDLPQPQIINKICERLCDNSIMSTFRKGVYFGDEIYVYCKKFDSFDKDTKEFVLHYANSAAFGFKYIYNYYKDSVLPIVGTNFEGKISIGTSFIYRNGIVTAKHCIDDIDYISIKGFSGEQLNNSRIYVSDDPNIDIAYIKIPDMKKYKITVVADGEILQNVITMGYPKIPNFNSFLTVEKSMISSIKEREIISTKGEIVSKQESYNLKSNSLLITARIKGGNSGGPVINELGVVVGITLDTLIGEGDYDDLGYAVAAPASDILKVVFSEKIYDRGKIFVDFID